MSQSPRESRLKSVGYYLLVPGLLLFNWAVFRYLLGTDYLAWYLANGALIGVSTAFVARIWESVEQLGEPLVSANPRRYYAGCMFAVAAVFFVISATFGSWVSERSHPVKMIDTQLTDWGGHQSEETDEEQPAVRSRDVLPTLVGVLLMLSEVLLTVVIGLFVVAAVFGWLLFVAPANYIVTLIAGAPTRDYLRNPEHRVFSVVEPSSVDSAELAPGSDDGYRIGPAYISPGHDLYIYQVGADSEVREALEKKDEEGKLSDITFGRNPFGTTQTLAGFVVFVAGALL